MRVYHVLGPAVVLAAAGYLLLGRPSNKPAGSTSAETELAQVNGAAGRPLSHVQRRRYALDYRQQVSVDEQAIPPTTLKGIWTTEPFADGRLGVGLTEVSVEGVQDIPAPAELMEPFQIGTASDGHIHRFGFTSSTPLTARGLLTNVASTLWYSPGEGDHWTVEEEDRTGRYLAVYQRAGNEVTRRRERYLAVREGDELNTMHAGRFSIEGLTRYRLDAGAVVQVDVDEHIRMVIAETMPKVDLRVQATLRLLGNDTVVARTAEPLPLTAPLAHGKAGEASVQEIERNRLGDTKLPDLVAKLEDVRKISSRDTERAWRAETFLKLRALLRLDPASIGQVAELLKTHAEDDPRIVSLIAGALGETRTPEATEALVGLLNENLPPLARMHVVGALGAALPSAQSVDALIAKLDDNELGPMSALALGAQANHLAAEDPATSSTAVKTLLDRYNNASDLSERRTYLSALANSGSPEALPAMQAALGAEDPSLEETAIYGLRFIPGTKVDALLSQILDGSGPDRVKMQAINAIAFRSPKLWQDPLEKAAMQYASNETMRNAIDQVLKSWSL